MGKFSRLGNDLYGGRKSMDFVGRRAPWYLLSLVLVGAAIAIVLIKGMNFGIEFTGGTEFRISNLAASEATQAKADDLREAIADTGVAAAESPTVTTSGNDALLLQTESLTQEESTQLEQVITDTLQVGDPAQDISQSEIGASWGKEVGQRAAFGVLVFLILVVLFIWGYFREWKMSVAALIALFHDIAITIGIYALSGFQVTPSAVTGLLAILGFSLYDTVVVFDKVKENTTTLRKGGETYQHAANLAVNQTLVRSINTGIVALIPIGAILYVSAVQLGASSLQDLALSQFVGMAVGVYSSIFLAPRVLVHMKSGESEVVLAERRAKARARRDADRYATVPSFAEGMPVAEDGEPVEGDSVDGAEDGDSPRTPVTAPPRRSEASGRGRTLPESTRPVGESRSAGRNQPSRQPRSKRDKK